MRQKNQFLQKNGKGKSICSAEATIQTTSRQLSPKSPQIWSQSLIAQISFPQLHDVNFQYKIKELLEEKQKLIQKSSAQDLLINRLTVQEEDTEPVRESRINTLNTIRQFEKKDKQKIQKPIYTRENSKDDKLMFTFFSPEPQPKPSICKLPKVFQVIPKKKKFFA